MYNNTTILTQLLQLADRLGFGKIASEEKTDKRYRNFSARTHLFAMIFAQLTKQNGLRSIENALESDNDLYHAGIKSKITRTNLAHANENRDCAVSQKFYFHLLEHYKALKGSKVDKTTKNLKLIDATTISLNLNQFSWAKFRSTKGGIKVNTRFDYAFDCADFLFITNANKHENNTLKSMQLTENDIAVFDRGYFNKKQFSDFTKAGIFFVTRLKDNVHYSVENTRPVCGKKNSDYKILSNQIIRMRINRARKGSEEVVLRIVVSKDLKTRKEIKLLTNLLEKDSLEIAEIYKKRWTIEIFFKMIKQNLRIKKFYGQSENAVKTQIWIALITHMLFLILKTENPDSQRTFSSFCSEIPVVLFKHRNIKKWFCGDYEKAPPKIIRSPVSDWLFLEMAS